MWGNESMDVSMYGGDQRPSMEATSSSSSALACLYFSASAYERSEHLKVRLETRISYLVFLLYRISLLFQMLYLSFQLLGFDIHLS